MTEARISWDEYFMEMALLASKRSSCERLHVGCVLVKDKRVVATGYNGHIAGCKHESFVRNGSEQFTIHAEQNSLLQCAKLGISCENAVCYTTHYPCLICFKMLAGAGIKTIFYKECYKNDTLVNVLAKQANINILKLD